MDLKGSLTDTYLKIYPTYKLIEFMKTIPLSDQLPYNILQIIKPNTNSVSKSYKLRNVKPVQLSSNDMKKLEMIREKFGEIYRDKSIEDLNKGLDMESKTIENLEDVENGELPNEEFKSKEESSEKKFEMDTRNIDPEFQNMGTNENQNSVKENLNTKDVKCNFDSEPFLTTSDIDWLYEYIKTRRSNGEIDIPYLHTLLEGASIKIPENETIERNPVLEARCVKLRAQQDAREYRKMTKGVDNVRMRFPEDSISYQLKQLNRQLIAIGQFIISIFAGFLFGFRGVEWMVGNLDFGFRLLLGVMCALVIALAEIYFLAKKLNEELCIPETVQLGGPVKFKDPDSYTYRNSGTGLEKQHQD